jgi:heme/copper-type cytochrome/quinol oxidase subunit 1
MGIAALVLGIVSIVFCFTGGLAFIAPILGVVGIVLGVIARKNAKTTKEPTGAATAGLVMSIIGVVLGAIIWIACIACASVATKGLSDVVNDPKFQKQLEDMKNDPNLKKQIEDANKELDKLKDKKTK